MTRFAVGQTVTSQDPVVVVDAGLAVGLHRFRLVVGDDGGNESKPTEVVVQVSPTTQPTVPPIRPPITPTTRSAAAKLPKRGPR